MLLKLGQNNTISMCKNRGIYTKQDVTCFLKHFLQQSNCTVDSTTFKNIYLNHS